MKIELGSTSYPVQQGLAKKLLSVVSMAIDRLSRAKKDEEDDETLENVRMERPRLLYADVVRGKVAPQKMRSRDALVLVETCAGDSGRVEYKSTVYTEEFDDKTQKVERVYRGAFPPIGVEVIAEGEDPQGSRCMLLRMKPNASFRIERSGALEGESPILTVIWTGGRSRRRGEDVSLPLLVVPPRKYQRAST